MPKRKEMIICKAEIKRVDIRRLAWQKNIDNIQDSKYLFYTYYMDKDEFREAYGEEKLKLAAAYSETSDGNYDEKTQVIYWYLRH